MDIRLAVPGIIGLVVFIIIFNVYHIIKIRRKRTPRTDAVNAFQTNYKKNTANAKRKPEQTKPDDYVRFITKYNSSVDFVDKDDFIKEAVEQNKNQHPGGRYEKSLKGAGRETTIR